jgi:hypothetical protein
MLFFLWERAGMSGLSIMLYALPVNKQEIPYHRQTFLI